jgi:hypothetical protein
MAAIVHMTWKQWLQSYHLMAVFVNMTWKEYVDPELSPDIQKLNLCLLNKHWYTASCFSMYTSLNIMVRRAGDSERFRDLQYGII